jgi:hypothetical protein
LVNEVLPSETDGGLTSPPKAPFGLTVGVTGHRRRALSDQSGSIGRECGEALALVAKVAASVRAAEAAWFSAGESALNLLSPLAGGADQIVAQAGLERGYCLHAILPFEKQDYRATLDDEGDRARFDTLIGRADRILELPGERGAETEAYVMAGRATVAHCDLLLAVWDGEPPRGRGGTADVVELAVRRGVAVIHVDPSGRTPTGLLWSGFDPAVVTEKLQQTVRRPFDAEHLSDYFTAIVAPPADADERRFAAIFGGEKLPRFRMRIEYPLLLAVGGSARFDPKSVREAHCAAAVSAEWDAFRDNCAAAHEVAPALDVLRASYCWSDQLAGRFAQTYRSGHIFNFLLGGIAVCMGLIANILSQFQLQFAVVEGIVAAMILVNTRMGVRNEWHRRWLDYRQLAERLRPMRSLKLLALAAPDPPGTSASPTPRRWTEWYALAVWRAMGCPSGKISPARAGELGKAIAAHEIAPQMTYHRKHARQIALLDHRLERISATLFWFTLIVSAIVVAGSVTRPDLVNRYGAWLTLVGAGFPALGTAVFGIRFQADFGGSAVRSENTAKALGNIEAELGDGVPLDRAADLIEQAARVMLADLDEWRLVNQQQELDLL